jgi:hypothetical protein
MACAGLVRYPVGSFSRGTVSFLTYWEITTDIAGKDLVARITFVSSDRFFSGEVPLRKVPTRIAAQTAATTPNNSNAMIGHLILFVPQI